MYGFSERDTLRVPLSLFWSGPAPLIFTKILKVPISLLRRVEICVIIYLDDMLLMSQTLEELSMSRDTKFFSSDSVEICNQFEKVYPSASPTNRIFRLGDRLCRNETISSSKKGGGDCSDFSKCNERQFDLKGFDKSTREVDFHNSSNFTSKTSDSFPAVDTNTGPEKKRDLQICDFSGPAGQTGAVMVDNQHVNLQWKIFVNSAPRSNHIFRCIGEGLGCFRDGGLMVFSGESLAHKCSRIRSSEASNSFFYNIQETKINSSTDRQHDSSLLFIKHGRNPTNI